MPTKVFFVKEQGDVQLYLRRYHLTEEGDVKCPSKYGYCQAIVPLMRIPAKKNADGYFEGQWDLKPPKDDSRWPLECETCGKPFADTDEWQLFQDQYMITDDGCEFLRRNLPVGACFESWWYKPHWVGADGRSLTVVLPGNHEWCIDARANNCTMKEDNVHKCWVRHGKPEDGTLHVDKNGHTCAAGAGSILVPGYHGFLHNGFLTDNC